MDNEIRKDGGLNMGAYREFNFNDDIELLNLKYQMNGLGFKNYFEQEKGADELILGTEINEKTEEQKNQL